MNFSLNVNTTFTDQCFIQRIKIHTKYPEGHLDLSHSTFYMRISCLFPSYNLWLNPWLLRHANAFASQILFNAALLSTFCLDSFNFCIYRHDLTFSAMHHRLRFDNYKPGGTIIMGYHFMWGILASPDWWVKNVWDRMYLLNCTSWERRCVSI